MNKKEFAKLLSLLCGKYKKEIDQAFIDVYFDVLNKYTIDQISKSFTKISESDLCSSFPKPSDIIAGIEEQEKTKSPPAISIHDDIRDLTGIIRDLSGSVSNIKEAQEKVTEQLAAYKEMSAKGFPLPQTEKIAEQTIKKDSVLKRVKMAIQGKELMDKRFYPNYQMSEESRQEVAKWLCLFYKGGVLQNQKAKDEFWDTFGPTFRVEGKTNVGDLGNLFPVTDNIESEILAFARETSVALQYARVTPMTTEKDTFPAESSGVTVAWSNTTPASDAVVADVEVTCYELSAYSTVRNTSLDDSPSDIVSWLFSNMSEAVGMELDNVMWNGDGTSTYANCSGIFLTAGKSILLGSGSTAFSNIDATNLSRMIAQLDGKRKQGARFFMHGEILHFVRSLTDDNNKPIFLETVGSAIPAAIWGYPYTESTKCPSTSAAETFFIAFGNLRHFLVGRRQGVTALQVNPWEKWTTNRTCYKVYSRWGLKTGLADGLVRLATAAT